MSAVLNNNKTIEGFLKILESSEKFDTVCKNFLKSICETLSAQTATVTVSEYEDAAPTSYEYIADSGKYSVFSFDRKGNGIIYDYIKSALDSGGIHIADKSCPLENGRCIILNNVSYPCSLTCAIKESSVSVAFFNLLCSDKERAWTNEEISLVSQLTYILAGMLHTQRASDHAENTSRTLTDVMDNMSSYVIAMVDDTDEIIFASKRLEKYFGKDLVGKNGTDIFRYTQDEINKTKDGKFFNGDFYSKTMDKWLDVSEKLIKWHDGRTVRLCTLNDISDKIEYERVIEKQVFFDSLTGLTNRRSLDQSIQNVIETETDSTIILLDLDNFKNINDSYGHNNGDRLLMEIGEFFKKLAENNKELSVFRFGGDEMVVLIKSQDSDIVDRICGEIHEKFNEEWQIANLSCYCTCSMGIATFPKPDDTVNTVLKRIDLAIYYAKKHGKNCMVHYNEKIGRILTRQMDLERLMHKDISCGFRHFSAYYQPIFSSTTKKLVGCEALMRWCPPEYGQVPPSEFIPMAEKLGYINLLGENIIRVAGTQCREWVDAGLNLRVNINLSVGQLIEPDFVENLDRVFSEINAPLENICFEVTESLAINDMAKMKMILTDIANKGIKIALDDFGTGYSSLNCIKEMPLNTIKIDKSFIDDIAKNPNTAVFVKTIVNLSHDLNIAVCAEGVEEQMQFEILRDLDTDVIQGYYFGRPMPAEKFKENYLMTE